MKRAYIVICWETDGVNTFTGEKAEKEYYYTVDYMKAGDNIKSFIDNRQCKYIHLCESKKDAERLRAFWEECERKNRAERRARAAQ